MSDTVATAMIATAERQFAIPAIEATKQAAEVTKQVAKQSEEATKQVAKQSEEVTKQFYAVVRYTFLRHVVTAIGVTLAMIAALIKPELGWQMASIATVLGGWDAITTLLDKRKTPKLPAGGPGALPPAGD